MREIVQVQAGQCGNQIGTKVRAFKFGDCAVLLDTGICWENCALPYHVVMHFRIIADCKNGRNFRKCTF